MIVFDLVADPYGFCTGGYAPGFVRDWWNARIATGEFVKTPQGYRFTPEAEATLLHRLAFVTGYRKQVCRDGQATLCGHGASQLQPVGYLG